MTKLNAKHSKVQYFEDVPPATEELPKIEDNFKQLKEKYDSRFSQCMLFCF